MQDTWILSLDGEEPLEEEMAKHSNILAWKIPWTKDSGGLQSMGTQSVEYNLVTEHAHNLKNYIKNIQRWRWDRKSVV